VSAKAGTGTCSLCEESLDEGPHYCVPKFRPSITTQPPDTPNEGLLPCGLCGAMPEYFDDPDCSTKWFHPGTLNEGDCFLRGQGISDIDLWNRRIPPAAGDSVNESQPFTSEHSESVTASSLSLAATDDMDALVEFILMTVKRDDLSDGMKVITIKQAALSVHRVGKVERRDGQ
jgi:hypothetical protein